MLDGCTSAVSHSCVTRMVLDTACIAGRDESISDRRDRSLQRSCNAVNSPVGLWGVILELKRFDTVSRLLEPEDRDELVPRAARPCDRSAHHLNPRLSPSCVHFAKE